VDKSCTQYDYTPLETGERMPQEIKIRIKGLTKYYGPTRGIEDLDLEVQSGEKFGFLGPNGAGKTTTIRGNRLFRLTKKA